MNPRFSRKVIGFLFYLPLIALVVGFFAYLLASSIFISFKNVLFGGMAAAKFVGFSNYIELFFSRDFWYSMRFSFIFGITTAFLELALGFLLAYYFYSKFRGSKFLFTFLISPMFIAPSLFGLMNRILFNNFIGLIPGYVRSLFGISVDFFHPNNIFWTLVGIDLLQWTPFLFLIIYAALLGIPIQLIEAASIDGAGRFQKVVNIVLPYIKPALISGGFLRFIESFRSFDSIYVLTGGGPGSLTTTISIFIYRTSFTMGNQGLSSAAGILLFLVMLFPLFLASKVMRKEW
ncbi:carbohydrate ABC transporter permease [Pseudothermotoga thermarum]|uniref:Binding-protein-dependent transport systems inner membrane component n=1 Tax=Pseudothermotoga thermarum DSM 5069 TaxID=688269 RepID=F7YVC3_9THEM|nr:sugar ABC transporter permease [Pseudothermotoga thermarum]AEH50426.1 binding-protein-dependent transport systems inner membrane component [Pseudothermotoga thermarum DSM 5069]